jgi:DNA-binding response OmpR family regulator
MSDPASADDQPVILAADDDEDILQLVAFRLGRAGYRVLQARDGEEAIALATEHEPDLAVLDVGMPKMDGLEVARRLRAAEATKSIPIIMLTARAQDTDVQGGFDAGANDYLRKPFSPNELRTRVEALLARR